MTESTGPTACPVPSANAVWVSAGHPGLHWPQRIEDEPRKIPPLRLLQQHPNWPCCLHSASSNPLLFCNWSDCSKWPYVTPLLLKAIPSPFSPSLALELLYDMDLFRLFSLAPQRPSPPPLDIHKILLPSHEMPLYPLHLTNPFLPLRGLPRGHLPIRTSPDYIVSSLHSCGSRWGGYFDSIHCTWCVPLPNDLSHYNWNFVCFFLMNKFYFFSSSIRFIKKLSRKHKRSSCTSSPPHHHHHISPLLASCIYIYTT